MTPRLGTLKSLRLGNSLNNSIEYRKIKNVLVFYPKKGEKNSLKAPLNKVDINDYIR